MKIATYLLCSLLLYSSKSPAQVVLTEIMFDALGSDSHDEFVEIVNLSNETVDLTAWQISDGTGFDTIVEVAQGTILQPGQFGIILDASYFSNSTTYDNIIPEGSLILTIDNQTFGSGGFTNSRPETVTLIDAAGNVVSEYTYSIGNEMGFSDEKINLSGPNSADNWADSKVQFGTPGARNSVSPRNFDLAIFSNDINFTPEKIIAGEPVVISAKVRNLGLSAATDFQVTFFEDLNSNLSPDSGEELATPLEFRDNLVSGDSVSLSIDYTALTAGEHLIFVKIDFEADEDTTNNLASKTLLIGSPEGAVVINEIMFPFD